MRKQDAPHTSIPIEWIKDKIRNCTEAQYIAEYVEGDIPYWRELEHKKTVLEDLISEYDEWRGLDG